MPEISLPVESGRTTGTRASGRLRAEGRIPGVVYGHGQEAMPVSVEGRALRAALSQDGGLNALLRLELDGKTQLAMAKDIQRDPVRGTVAHVDFLVVRRDEIVSVDIPVILEGEAKAVNTAGGTLTLEVHSLSVHAPASDVPSSIVIDVSSLSIGDSVRVGDLPLPAGVTTDLDAETTVLVAQGQQVTEADLVTEGAEPAAAGEAAEGAEAGATPAEDAGS